jgi:Tfp pilus assembly protein PilO
MKTYNKVKGRDDLVRDVKNGALININRSEAERLRNVRRDRKNKDAKLQALENEMSEMKALLKQLIEKQ